MTTALAVLLGLVVVAASDPADLLESDTMATIAAEIDMGPRNPAALADGKLAAETMRRELASEALPPRLAVLQKGTDTDPQWRGARVAVALSYLMSMGLKMKHILLRGAEDDPGAVDLISAAPLPMTRWSAALRRGDGGSSLRFLDGPKRERLEDLNDEERRACVMMSPRRMAIQLRDVGRWPLARPLWEHLNEQITDKEEKQAMQPAHEHMLTVMYLYYCGIAVPRSGGDAHDGDSSICSPLAMPWVYMLPPTMAGGALQVSGEVADLLAMFNFGSMMGDMRRTFTGLFTHAKTWLEAAAAAEEYTHAPLARRLLDTLTFERFAWVTDGVLSRAFGEDGGAVGLRPGMDLFDHDGAEWPPLNLDKRRHPYADEDHRMLCPTRGYPAGATVFNSYTAEQRPMGHWFSTYGFLPPEAFATVVIVLDAAHPLIAPLGSDRHLAAGLPLEWELHEAPAADEYRLNVPGSIIAAAARLVGDPPAFSHDELSDAGRAFIADVFAHTASSRAEASARLEAACARRNDACHPLIMAMARRETALAAQIRDSYAKLYL